MIPFSRDDQKYEFKLDPTSVVIDAGCHKGCWTREITRRYDCWVIGYEPIPEFWRQAIENQTEKVTIYQCGIGSSDHEAIFEVRGDSTTEYGAKEGVETCTATVVDVAHLKHMHPSLIKINIEGGEYDLLNRMLWCGLAQVTPDILVQFHTNIELYEQRYENIAHQLSETHELTFKEMFIWECWHRR